MLFCTQITKSFGSQLLLDEASFQLNLGEKVGVLGRNGSGKSTLFQMILGRERVDEGEISFPENYRIGYLDQHLEFTQPTILKEVVQNLPADQKYDDWKGKKYLSGLGFEESDFDRAPSEFSGGFQIRIKLAGLLLSDPDLLLLDEPTNYLDIVAIRWLEQFLRSWKGELMCISHDRTFLERITNHTVVFHRQKLKKGKGTPDQLYAQIAREEEIYEKTRLNAEKERSRQEKFIREFRSGARSAGLVQSRIKMLNKKGVGKALKPIRPIFFRFPQTPFVGAKMLEGRSLRFGYEKEQDLLKGVSVEIFPGDKLGIIGANGKGKTTLLNVLSGQIQMHSGTHKVHSNTRMAFFGQSNIERLDKTKTILEELMSGGDLREQDVRKIAGSLLFTRDLVYKKIDQLSGGEKARVNLGKMMTRESNLLFFDEPTNHLDYESVEALIQALNEYEGAVVFVSHNEEFLRRVAQKLVVFDGGAVTEFPQGYEDFLQQRGFEEEKDEASAEKPKKKKDLSREDQKQIQKKIRSLKKKQKEWEKRISEIEEQQQKNRDEFSMALGQGNRIKMDTLGVKYAKLQEKLEVEFEGWERVSNEIQELSTNNQ